MDVAVLSASLRAEIGAFLRNLDTADVALADMRRSLDALERRSAEASEALKQVEMTRAQAAQTEQSIRGMRDALGDLARSAGDAEAGIGRVGIGAGKVAAFKAEAEVMQRALKGIGDQAVRTEAEIKGIEIRSYSGALRSSLAQSAWRSSLDVMTSATADRNGRFFVAPQGGAPGTSMVLASQARMWEQQLLQNRVFTQTGAVATPQWPSSPVVPGTTVRRLAGIFTDPNFANSYEVRRDWMSDGASRSALQRFVGRFVGNAVGDAIRADAGSAGGRGGSGGGGGRWLDLNPFDSSSSTRGPLAGVLPGGRRMAPSAIFALSGAAGAIGPQIAPATLAIASATEGLTALVAGIAVTKLAFSGLTKEAFTQKAAFDLLSGSQKELVQSLRSLQAGLGANLKQIAQQNILPDMSQALHDAFSPQTTSAITRGVQSISKVIGEETKKWGQYVGSSEFASQFGQLLQRDAGHVGELSQAFRNLTDATLRFLNSGGEFTTFLSQGTVHFTEWLDKETKVAQETGTLSRVFDDAKEAVHDLGAIFGALWHALDAIFSVLGPSGGIAINLLVGALNELAAILNQNRDQLAAFFRGAAQAVGDLFSVLQLVNPLLHAILSAIGDVTGAFGGWRVIIDTVIVVMVARMALLKSGLLGVEGAASLAGIGVSKGMTAARDGILGASNAAGGLVGKLGTLAKIAAAGIVVPIIIQQLNPGDKSASGNILKYGSYGAGIGGVVGSIVPGVGTLLGVGVGGLVGMAYGGIGSALGMFNGQSGGLPASMWPSKAGLSPAVPIVGNNPTIEQIKRMAFAAGLGQQGQAIFAALVQKESQGHQLGPHGATLTNPDSGAMGLTQLMPGTARGLGVNPNDATQNLYGGATYFASLLKQYKGDPSLALAAYNAGPGKVAKYHGIPPYKETVDYINEILGSAGVTGGKVAFGRPKQLTDKTAGQLPVDLQVALANAQAFGSTGAQVSALRAQASYLKGAIPGLQGQKDQTGLLAALQQYASIQQQIKSLTSTGSGTVPLHKVLPAEYRSRLAAAQAAQALNPMQGSSQVIDAAQAALKYLDAQKASGERLVTIERERKTLNTAIAAAHAKIDSLIINEGKELAKAITIGRQEAAAASERKILGIAAPGADTTPGLFALRSAAKRVAQAVADSPLADSAAVRKQIDKINEVIANSFAPDDVRQAVRDRLSAISADAKQALKDLNAAVKQEGKELAEAIKKGREEQQLGVLEAAGIGAADASPTVAGLKRQLAAVQHTIETAMFPVTRTTKGYVDAIAKVLGGGNIVSPTVINTIIGELQVVKGALKDGLSAALDTAKQLASDARSSVDDVFSQILSSADSAFQQATAAKADAMRAAMNTHLQGMQDATSTKLAEMRRSTSDAVARMQTDMQAHLRTMQITVAGFGFQYGSDKYGNVSQTPAQQQLVAMQEAARQQDMRDALTAARKAYDDAVANNDQNALPQAQKALRDAQLAIQTDALQKQADLEQKAAREQLQDAQDAYQAQAEAAIQSYQDTAAAAEDAYAKAQKAAEDSYQSQQEDAIKAFEAQRSEEQKTMDVMVKAIVDGMATGKIEALAGIAQITKVLTDHGVDASKAGFVLGNSLYSGLSDGLQPVFALLKALQQAMTAVHLLDPSAPAWTAPATSPPGWYPGVGGNGPVPPGFASGTDSAPGGWATVGETGKELMFVPRGAQIMPASRTRALLDPGRGGPVVVHVTLEPQVIELDGREVARSTRRQLLRVQDQNSTLGFN